MKTNGINIVLLERCFHPLTGAFPESHKLDEPLDAGQIQMLRTAVDRMMEHIPEEAREVAAVLGGEDHPVPSQIDTGTARRLSRLISYLWEKTPDEERRQLSDWFRCFNTSPSRRHPVPEKPESACCDTSF
ncbi:hypothetical protein AB9K35_07730 [Leisingera sp. XS_AS12]|uniref:hypothetical protein n=1 Tax=Leisingera sp. XS_AS12 TaxID=3241294 RepID=UPI0035112DAF